MDRCPDATPAPLRRMLPLCIILAAGLLCVLNATPAFAVEPNAPGDAAPDAAAGSIQPLDRDLAEQVYLQVERWVQRGRAPNQPLPIEASDAAAVHVTVRLSGYTLGRGTAVYEAPTKAAADRAVDVGTLARDATAAALDRAGHALVQLAHRNPDAAFPAKLSEVSSVLDVDVQIAHAPRPVPMQQLDQLPRRVVIGVHGLAMRQRGKWSWVFPGDALAANLALEQQIQKLLAGVGLDAGAMMRINRQDGPELLAFETIHMIRPAADRGIRHLHRGQQVLPPTPHNFKRIDQLARTWADHLLGRQDADGHFAGAYQPTADRFDPQVAGIRESALACYALARYAGVAHVSSENAERYVRAARRGIDAALDTLDEPNAASPGVADAAMLLAAMIETPDTADLKARRDALADRLIKAFQRGRMKPTRADDPNQNNQRPAATPTDALAAFALSRYYDRTRSDQALAVAQNALAQIWNTVGKSQPVNVMPWAALAEFSLLRLDKATRGLVTVRRTCSTYWNQQVAPPEPAAPNSPWSADYVSPDTVGGFVLEALRAPEPTWRSADALVAQSAALQIPEFIDDDQRPQWILDCALGMRFLDQLTLTRDTAWYVHNLSAALGGVRMAFWNNRQPLAATSLALLAAAEYEHALAHLADRQSAP